MFTSTENRSGNAECRFRDAFERLKNGVPELLPRGTRVTQNNVAREADCDPSALRKSRFPVLVIEIQEWVKTHSEDQSTSERQRLFKMRGRNRGINERLVDARTQRDIVAGLLVDADLQIIELLDALEDAGTSRR